MAQNSSSKRPTSAYPARRSHKAKRSRGSRVGLPEGGVTGGFSPVSAPCRTRAEPRSPPRQFRSNQDARGHLWIGGFNNASSRLLNSEFRYTSPALNDAV